MKAEELRIGNLVWTDYSGEMLVSAIMDDKKNQYLCLRKNENFPDGRYIIGDVSGIPLTEEWLLKFEWQLVRNKSYYINSYFSISDTRCLYYHGDFTGIVIKHVHQLQNLYFALTGEELTINPTQP